MRTPSNITKRHRVLIGTPHSNIKNYCIDDYISRVKSLSYQHYDVLVVDNSKDRKNYKKLLKAGVMAIHIKPKNKSIYAILAESHEAIRKYAIAHKYDYLLHWESDIIPPKNIIERLMIHNRPIVSAMYMINFGSESHLMAQKIEDFGEIRETINMKDGTDLMMVDGKLKVVYACGLGIVLIHRDILPLFKFRHEEGVNLAPDSLWSMDISALGIPKVIDTGILCSHQNSPWIHS